MIQKLFLMLVSTNVLAASLINGAGATFPYPLYSKWFSDYQKVDTSVQFNYQSIGSGGGIRQLLEKTVDFGASDAPMNDDQLKKAPQAVVHIPTVMGAVVVSYNLPELKGELKLDGAAIADIFMGKITKWNDPKIQALNPGVNLPTADVIPASRSDGSGTTYVFTDYLAKVSPDWKTKVGAGTAVKWPAGLSAKGNEGVTGLIKQNAGSIGYVELIYAEQNKLPYALVKNASGEFAKATMASVSAAAQGYLKEMPADFRISITNAPNKGAYPISSFTYLLVYEKMPKATGEKIVKFLKWALADGQKMAAPLFYAPLPAELAKKAALRVNGLKFE